VEQVNAVVDTNCAITKKVIEVLNDLTQDWDMAFTGGIGPDTRLVADLACESIDIVQFVLALEQSFGPGNYPFERLLMTDGRYVEDITVTDVVRFLREHVIS
jgi:acyl carrier protein